MDATSNNPGPLVFLFPNYVRCNCCGIIKHSMMHHGNEIDMHYIEVYERKSKGI